MVGIYWHDQYNDVFSVTLFDKFLLEYHLLQYTAVYMVFNTEQTTQFGSLRPQSKHLVSGQCAPVLAWHRPDAD